MASLPVVRQTEGAQSDERVREGHKAYCSHAGAEIQGEMPMMGCWVRGKPQLHTL